MELKGDEYEFYVIHRSDHPQNPLHGVESFTSSLVRLTLSL